MREALRLIPQRLLFCVLHFGVAASE